MCRSRNPTPSTRVHPQSSATCPLFLAQSPGHATSSIASPSPWNNSLPNSPSKRTTNAPSSNTTRSATLSSLMSTCGDKSGSKKLIRPKLACKPLLSFVTPTTTNCMLTSILRSSHSSVRLNACPVSESTFPKALRLSSYKKRNSSTTTLSSNLCSANTKESLTRSDLTLSRSSCPTWKISSTNSAPVWSRSPGPQ